MSISSSDRGRILVVDDDQRILDLLVELLEQEGYEISAAKDGAEALDLALSFEPDVVISDVVMPVVDGLQLYRRHKENPSTTNLPVLLISGTRHSPEDGIQGLYAGADDYLDIPFRNDELLVKVARLVERHRIEKHYREIVEQAADIIYTRDMDGRITSMNAAGARFFGLSVPELTGKHLSELIDPATAARDIAETRTHENQSPLRFTYYLADSNSNSPYLYIVITLEP